MAIHLKTFENFQEMELNPNKVSDLKPAVYLYVITNENGQDFEAEVRDEAGRCILQIDADFIDKGNMDHKDDLSGLREYLISKKKIRQNDEVTPGGNFTQQTIPAPAPVMESGLLRFDDYINESAEWADHIPGGRADERKPEDFDQFELELGQKVEREHTDSDERATEISMDHLEENPKYYTEGFEKGIFDEDVTDVLDKWKDDERAQKMMAKLPVKENESFSVERGKYLKFGDSFTSIPGPDDKSAVLVASRDDHHALIYSSKPGVIYFMGNKFDETFDDIESLAKWLNDKKYRYVGIDDRY